MLEIKNAVKVFRKGTPDEIKALNDISLSVKDGDFITVIGANGAGKSTLFGAISGNIITDSGKILLDGNDITLTSEQKRSRYIGRIFQDPMLGSAPGMSVEENLMLAAKRGNILSHITKKDREFFKEKLLPLSMGLENKLSVKVGSLSGGQRQALALIMATIDAPKILLLDEHTAALDPKTAETVLTLTNKTVCDEKLTCLMITHNMQSALDLGNRIIMMNRGNIVFDAEGEEKKKLGVSDLTEFFKTKVGEALTSDKMMLQE